MSNPSRPDCPSSSPSAPEPWYAGGLRFGCQRCGRCCQGEPGAVWLQPDDVVALAGCLHEEPGHFERHYVRSEGVRKRLYEWPDGRCVLLDTERGAACRAYAARPAQCRTWPFWRCNLVSVEAWQRASAQCPGCNQGRRHHREEIERLVRRTG